VRPHQSREISPDGWSFVLVYDSHSIQRLATTTLSQLVAREVSYPFPEIGGYLMRIHLGEQILTTDGREAGRVDKVILDPDRGNVDSVVLRRGMVFSHDVEVNLDQITEDSAGNHRLMLGSARLDELPPFDESKCTAPPAELALPYDNPRDHVLWPIGWATTPTAPMVEPLGGDRAVAEEVRGRLYEQDWESAVIDSSSDVVSRDGKKVGELARLSFSEADGRLTSLAIRQGFLFPKEVELAGSLVDSADDGVLYLNVDSGLLNELAEET
jgi:sporulation protein YlmC with PRC-barrel domain